ncbi:hypothetical protein [Streptomyces sp. NPDC058045]|uniref:hypothetical protein n=1 Tax=Streptomyces sp. NPDC058045 TaxID=3346311 RepID=UPI0036E8975A
MSDYDELTNADVMSADETAEYALDAADEARWAAEDAAAQAAEPYDDGDDGECHGEFIDGTWTDCDCPECEHHAAELDDQ